MEEGRVQDIIIRQNSTFHRTFLIYADDKKTLEELPDGTTAEAEVRANGELRLSFVCTVDTDTSSVSIDASDEDTDAVISGGDWDLYLLLPDDTKVQVRRGLARLVKKVTVTA